MKKTILNKKFSSAAVEDAVFEPYEMKVVSGPVSIFAEKDAASQVLASVENDAVITVTGEKQDGYVPVSYNDGDKTINGWMSIQGQDACWELD